jgi:hypothetical protein
MLEKINGKKKLLFRCFIVSLFLVLVYSRFVGLDWGLPHSMHPDERNMVSAIQQLNCKFSSASWRINFQECFNPHFFAYGQLPLYLGYFIIYFFKIEATISLRIISAIASILNVFVLIRIVELISNIKNQISNTHIKYQKLLILLVLIFAPFFIQFSHFGTTESLLMLFYSLIIYLSMLMFERRTTDIVVWLALVSGLAVATKISSIIFIIVPLITILSSLRSWDRYKNLVKFGMLTIIFMVLFSPHNFINFKDFISSMNYESDVALGNSLVFYTRQFFKTQPFYFQLEKVFPYALGWPTYIMGSLGFIGLSWRDKKINLLRFAFLIYFIPSALIYAKWSRFMAPVFPIITIFAILFILNIKDKISKIHIKYQNFYILICNFAFCTLIFAMIISGFAYLSVYQNPDVRFQASDWIYKNIPNNNYLLFETANVVDIPISNPKSQIPNLDYQTVSFNFYDLDESLELQLELKNHLEKADYIFIPSRRIFANHPKEKYPILTKYYEDLFSGKLGFEKVAEFQSYPEIKFSIFNFQFSMNFPDEQAEETWTVFDHPVIRIYKRTNI